MTLGGIAVPRLSALVLPALAGLLALAPGNRAWGEGEPPSTEGAEEGTPAAPEGGTRRKGFFGAFELHARLIGRGQSTREGDVTESEDSTQNARLSLRWNPARWLRAEVEYDAAENRHFKDVNVRFRTRALRIKVGQFKPPLSSIERQSRWDLPTADRGLVNFVLRDAMGWGGRRPGVEVTWRLSKSLEASAGVFQGSHVRGDRIGTTSFNNIVKLKDTTVQALQAAGRIAWSRGRTEVGLFGEWRGAEPTPGLGYERFWMAGADFKWSDKPKRGGRRVWADAHVGSNWQDWNAFDQHPTTFLAGRIVGAWRRGGHKTAAFYVEPYVMGGLVDPDTHIRSDVVWELSGGVNVGLWQRLRATLEAQHHVYSRNVPPALGLLTWSTSGPPLGRDILVFQLGGAF
jgi:hypothetical protein